MCCVLLRVLVGYFLQSKMLFQGRMSSHISDVEHWGAPDRNYYIFVFLSVVFGFIGLDHFYLRSFGTGTQKLLVNLFCFGLWWVWDILQIARNGEQIRKEGLSSPLDWIRGIGKGVFRPLEGGGEPASPQKSYLLYAFLAIFFGWLGADKFYLGYGWQGLAKLLSTWNIFLFLFGFLWILWDSFHAFFMTDAILKDGISPPMPFNLFFSEPISPEIFKVQTGAGAEQTTCTEGPVWCTLDWVAKTFGFPKPPQGLPLGEIYKDLVAPIISTKLATQVQALRQEIQNPVPLPTLPTFPELDIKSIATKISEPITANTVATNTHEEQKQPIAQSGGAYKPEGPGPVIAGALTALIVAGGLKGCYDFISKQYG